MTKKPFRVAPRRWLWLLGVIPIASSAYSIAAQPGPTAAGEAKSRIKARQRPRPGSVIFNDQSPRPTNNNLVNSTYVGYQVCAGCHGRLTSTRPSHTIIDEWEAPSNFHSKDATKLGSSGTTNVYTRTVTDGEAVDGTKSCGTCHSTGAPTIQEPQTASRGGFDPSVPYNDVVRNHLFLRVQCENCHGPGSKHVLSGGDIRRINRVPDPKQTCWNCHASTPNEKGNPLIGPTSDETIAKYGSSLGRSHNAGVMVTGQGGFEYEGEDYSQGHSQAHSRIRTTCVTCHTARDPRSPILDHSSLVPKITACRSCHTDARRVADLDSWAYLNTRRSTIRQLLIQLGGATSSGDPDNNAAGGLLGNAADKTSVEYKRARWNYSLVINDGSLGVHNYDYALELLLSSITHAPAQVVP